MNKNDSFWQASIPELKQGYYLHPATNDYTCLICGKEFQEGVVYPIEEVLYTPEKAAAIHVHSAHGDMFDFFLDMGKTYTGLTKNQEELMRLFYQGYSDREILDKTGANSTSTIRNQRFSFREKYKQAKIIVAMTELLEEKKEAHKKMRRSNTEKIIKEELVDIHRTATCIDNRYVITQAEKDDVLKRYFDTDNKLMIANFPAKEKKKIIILQHIMEEFEPDRAYEEKEVNEIIQHFYIDYVTIRRYLIEYGFLDRQKDGKTYWVKR